MNIGKTVRGSVHECVGTIGGGGVFGNHYERVSPKDILFDEWNPGDLVLAEWMYGMEPQSVLNREPPYNWVRKNFNCSHRYYMIIREHKHWGVFIPSGTPIECVERSLAWLRLYGQKPKIEDDDPGTYAYRTKVVNGVEIDALERVVRK